MPDPIIECDTLRFLPALPPGITLQPGEKSFTEAEIADVSKKVVAAAEKLGAQLRG